MRLVHAYMEERCDTSPEERVLQKTQDFFQWNCQNSVNFNCILQCEIDTEYPVVQLRH